MSCVASGEQPRTDGEVGLAVVKVLEGAELLRFCLGRPVALDELGADRSLADVS